MSLATPDSGEAEITSSSPPKVSLVDSVPNDTSAEAKNTPSVSFSPASHKAQPFPSIPQTTSLEFLKSACPDAHNYTKSVIHSSMGSTLKDVKPQRNGFVHTLLECYNEHRALTIRPDDIWLAILTQFSCFVNGVVGGPGVGARSAA